MSNSFLASIASDLYNAGFNDALAGRLNTVRTTDSYQSGYDDAKRLHPNDCKVNHPLRTDIESQRDDLIQTLRAVGHSQKIYAIKLYRMIFQAGLVEAKRKIEES